MLSDGRAGLLVAAARPAARTVPWAMAGGILGLAWAPLAITMLRGGEELVAAYVFAAVVGTGVVALAVDDDAAEVAAALPVPLARRRGVRFVELLAAFVVVAAVAFVAGGARDAAVLATADDRAAEAAAVAALAVAWASLLADRGRTSAGAIGAGAASLSVGLVSALAERLAWLPAISRDQHHGWWWSVAAVGVAAAAWQWRDPAARRPVRWRG